ncbi:MAG: low molecular weight protein-tyrosine-phosphatase [Holophaga sp.]|jgi:protein-tyrosine phosphatase
MIDRNTILVLCEGNLCRSPIAAALLQAALGPEFTVASAGLSAREGLPAHPEAVRLASARRLDLSGHAARQLTSAMALGADLILVMDRVQKDRCEGLVPSARGRVFLLGRWRRPAPFEIADPYGRGPDAFLAAFEAIGQCVADWVPHLLSERRSA